jgi:hypothetical protein
MRVKRFLKMMNNIMDGGMWMGIGAIILLIVLVLTIAAHVKYVFCR